MKEMWNQRFEKEEYAYGKEPNAFFKEQIDKFDPGKILLLGEGEGRNSIYAAKLGWRVDAVDWSDAGKKKCQKLASENNVEINYIVSDLAEFIPQEETYDAVGLVFVHLNPELREIVHKRAADSLKKGGRIILESYDKDQINYSSGGPKNLDLLNSLEEIFSDFKDLDIESFSKEKITLKESNLHTGEAVVIRYVGVKP